MYVLLAWNSSCTRHRWSYPTQNDHRCGTENLDFSENSSQWEGGNRRHPACRQNMLQKAPLELGVNWPFSICRFSYSYSEQGIRRQGASGNPVMNAKMRNKQFASQRPVYGDGNRWLITVPLSLPRRLAKARYWISHDRQHAVNDRRGRSPYQTVSPQPRP